MKFISELKRRNVFRVGIAYLVGGWLTLQLTDVLSELLDLPDVVGRVVVMLVAIGLPAALFLAWAFELTPEGVRREKDVEHGESIAPQTGKKLNNTILVLMAIAIAYLLFDKFHEEGTEPVSQQSSGQNTPLEEKTAPAPIQKKSIAVLPFNNRSRLEEDEYFVEGMHDDLLTNLAKIGSLKVISRTSVMRFKDTEVPIPEIARELGVATIMEGAVQRAGDTVRINVQLIDAETDEHLWAEIFDRQLTTENLFAIQSEISREIARVLEAKLSPGEQALVNARPTESLAAHSAYQRGRQLMARRTAETIDQALLEFQRAVELDPQFALAWVGVAEAAQLALNLSDMKRPEAQVLSSEAIEKALSINDQLGEAHLAHAELLRISRGPDEEAEAAYRLAIELSPGYARAWERFSSFIDGDIDRLPEALELAEKAVELDPLSPAMQQQLIYVLNELGQSEEAQKRLLHLIEQDPGFAKSYDQMSDFKYDEGQFAQAIIWRQRAQRLDPGNIRYVMREMFPQMHIGNTAALDRLLARMEDMDPNGSTLPFMETMINIYRQSYDAALEATNLYQQRTAFRPGSDFALILVQSMRNEPAAAREVAEERLPQFFTPAGWDEAIKYRPSTSCQVAWILSKTGDGQNARALAFKAIDAYKNDPAWQSDRISDFFPALCYMVADQPEEALQTIEEHTRNGQIERWWIALYHPAYQLLRNEPRFIAAEQQIMRFNATQRELLATLQAEEEK